MSILIIAEHDNSSLKPATLNSVTAAQEIGGDIDILVAGSACQAAAEQAAQIAGINKVLVADDAAYNHALAENVAPLIAEVGAGYSHILATATTTAKNIMPRAAALLDVQAISEISAVVSADTFKRPIYAGNVIATVQSSDAIKLLTVRGTAFDGAAAEGESTGGEHGGDAGGCAERAGRDAGCAAGQGTGVCDAGAGGVERGSGVDAGCGAVPAGEAGAADDRRAARGCCAAARIQKY